MFKKPLILAAVLTSTSVAYADPEQAYKGGKAVSDKITGANTLKMDDRGAEERLRDFLKQKGAEAGGGKRPTGSPDKEKKEGPKK
jgi:hypothetical protein